MNFRSVVVGLVAAAGAAVISPGVASAMPNGLPHADTVTTSPAVRSAGFVIPGADAGGDPTTTGPTVMARDCMAPDFMAVTAIADGAGGEMKKGAVGPPFFGALVCLPQRPFLSRPRFSIALLSPCLWTS